MEFEFNTEICLRSSDSYSEPTSCTIDVLPSAGGFANILLNLLRLDDSVKKGFGPLIFS